MNIQCAIYTKNIALYIIGYEKVVGSSIVGNLHNGFNCLIIATKPINKYKHKNIDAMVMLVMYVQFCVNYFTLLI
jgi:hypothetical protein